MNSIRSLLPNTASYNPTIVPSFTIVYATQSNTSKRFAEKIQKDSQILKVKSFVKNVSEISINDFENNLFMVFLISTYGEGGPTDDSIDFDKLLEKNKNGFRKNDLIYLNQFNYSIFGLGSRKYEHYNAMAKKLDKFLEKSGSTR